MAAGPHPLAPPEAAPAPYRDGSQHDQHPPTRPQSSPKENNMTTEIIEPGRYDYDLKVQFPSVYIPDHTPPSLRNEAAYATTRTRHAYGQFDLTEHIDRDVLLRHLVQKRCDDVIGVEIQVFGFNLTRVDTTGETR